MKQNNLLDEMQDKKRLQIESHGLWIAFFGLALVILVQNALGGGNEYRNSLGEIIIMFALALYLLPNYIRHGIWSTRLKPTLKTNLIISIATGLAMALYTGILRYIRDSNFLVAIVTAISQFAITTVLCLLLLTLCARMYKRRMQKLENPSEDDTNIPKA